MEKIIDWSLFFTAFIVFSLVFFVFFLHEHTVKEEEKEKLNMDIEYIKVIFNPYEMLIFLESKMNPSPIKLQYLLEVLKQKNAFMVKISKDETFFLTDVLPNYKDFKTRSEFYRALCNGLCELQEKYKNEIELLEITEIIGV